MADKLERTYNVPLREKFIRAPAWQKAKVAVRALQSFVKRHMKAEIVKIGPEVNKKIWANSIKNPPHHVKVTCVKVDNVCTVELEGVEFKALKPKGKEEKATGLKGKLQELTKVKEEDKKEEKKAEVKPKAEAKVEKKVEAKKPEVKKEAPKTEAKK
jgi:large subunit ribosomal protein L31e